MNSNQHKKGGLPYDEAIARSYEALDLPYGAPMEEVSRRFERYVEQCRPERHSGRPDLLSDAYQLTGVLNWAHGVILKAWQQARSRSDTGSAAASDLPYDPDLAWSYQALDLPYGAPLEEVSRRWKEYLKKCHPDRHADDPGKLPDANKLTQLLTQAHDRIRDAWRKHKPEA